MFAEMSPVTQSKADPPTCRMCARPARWLSGQGIYAAYCAGRSCANRERTCQSCGKAFVIGVDGAGNKYCSTACKVSGYNPRAEPVRVPCAWCGALSASRHRGTQWPYLCDPCLEPIRHVADRLKAHHVSIERARILVENPTCEICGADLLSKTRHSVSGKLSASLVVDHDHACCPAESHSCGKCIRGLICWQCNLAAGSVRDDPSIARQLADYLDRWDLFGQAGDNR